MKQLKSGTTLVEMIIYVGLLTVVLGLTANLFYQIASYRVNRRIEEVLFANSTLILDKIKGDIKKAQSIEVPVDSNYSNTLELTLSGGSVGYFVDNGVLKRNNESLTNERVIVDINQANMGFRKINSSIQLRILLKTKQKRFGMSEKEKIYQTTVFYDE